MVLAGVYVFFDGDSGRAVVLEIQLERIEQQKNIAGKDEHAFLDAGDVYKRQALTISAATEQCYVVSPDLYLEPGEYVAFLTLSAGHGDIAFTVCDTYGVSEDNKTGITLGAMELETGEDAGSISFTVEQEMKHVHMQLTCSEDDAELISGMEVRSAQLFYHYTLVGILLSLLVIIGFSVYTPVSYTHLDGYKRQVFQCTYPYSDRQEGQ